MTMHVKLSREMENYIKSKVASGFYRNSTEVIRDAIRRMQAEENRTAAGEAAIAQGEEQLDGRESFLPINTNGTQDAICYHHNAQQPVD